MKTLFLIFCGILLTTHHSFAGDCSKDMAEINLKDFKKGSEDVIIKLASPPNNISPDEIPFGKMIYVGNCGFIRLYNQKTETHSWKMFCKKGKEKNNFKVDANNPENFVEQEFTKSNKIPDAGIVVEPEGKTLKFRFVGVSDDDTKEAILEYYNHGPNTTGVLVKNIEGQELSKIQYSFTPSTVSTTRNNITANVSGPKKQDALVCFSDKDIKGKLSPFVAGANKLDTLNNSNRTTASKDVKAQIPKEIPQVYFASPPVDQVGAGRGVQSSVGRHQNTNPPTRTIPSTMPNSIPSTMPAPEGRH